MKVQSFKERRGKIILNEKEDSAHTSLEGSTTIISGVVGGGGEGGGWGVGGGEVVLLLSRDLLLKIPIVAKKRKNDKDGSSL